MNKKYKKYYIPIQEHIFILKKCGTFKDNKFIFIHNKTFHLKNSSLVGTKFVKNIQHSKQKIC